jgi:hypothetical protein
MAKSAIFTDILPPQSCTLSLVSGGSLKANTTYYYKIIAVMNTHKTINYNFGTGQSLPSMEFSITTTTNDKSVQFVFPYQKGIVGAWRIFRSEISGSYITEPTLGCISTFPNDADHNVANIVTFIDTGTAVSSNNVFFEKSHGYIQLSGNSTDIWSIEDLYQLDVANGWGVILRDGVNNYSICTHLLGYSGMLWEDKLKTLNFYDGFSNLTNTAFTFGQKIIDGYGTHYIKGCNIIIRTNYLCSFIFATLYSYSTTWRYESYDRINYASISFSIGVIRDAVISVLRNFIPLTTQTEFKNVMYVSCDSAFGSGLGTYDNVLMIEGSRAFQMTAGTMHCKNMSLYNLYQAGAVLLIGKNIICNFVNISLYNSLIGKCLVDSTGSIIYDKFSYNLEIRSQSGSVIVGANVKIYDIDSVLIVDEITDSYGKIDEQEITRIRYDASNLTLTPTEKTPLTIIISKEGYETYYGKSTYTISKNVDEKITLKKAIDIMLSPTGIHIKADPANITDRELLLN